MMEKAFGMALRRLRQQRGLTQAQLASRAGCSKSQISKYETGKGNPRIATVARLANSMGYSLSDLFRLMHLMAKGLADDDGDSEVGRS